MQRKNSISDERKEPMKKANNSKKLEIAKETLRQLDPKDLRVAGAGGGWSDTSVCPGVTDHCP
jgi:hypothetical protein